MTISEILYPSGLKLCTCKPHNSEHVVMTLATSEYPATHALLNKSTTPVVRRRLASQSMYLLIKC